MPKNLRKRGPIWWYRFNARGQTHEGSLETETLSVARERLEGIRRRFSDPKFGVRVRHTFDVAAERFSVEHFKTLKRKSRLRYVSSLLNLERTFRGVALADIGPAMLGEFEQLRLKEGVSGSTVRRDLACLSSLFSRAEEWEWVGGNPVKPYKRSRKTALKEGPARTRYLSHDEEAGVLGRAGAALQTLIMFAIDTGFRREEQFSLLWSDVDLMAGEATVRAKIAKNGKARTIPLLPRTLALLEAMPRGIGDAPVFTTYQGGRYSPNSPTVNDGLTKACRLAGVPRIQWHDLRRTCGCRLLQDLGLSIGEVSKWLGHGDVRITQERYAFLETDHLHKALQRGIAIGMNGQKLGHARDDIQ